MPWAGLLAGREEVRGSQGSKWVGTVLCHEGGVGPRVQLVLLPLAAGRLGKRLPSWGCLFPHLRSGGDDNACLMGAPEEEAWSPSVWLWATGHGNNHVPLTGDSSA